MASYDFDQWMNATDGHVPAAVTVTCEWSKLKVFSDAYLHFESHGDCFQSKLGRVRATDGCVPAVHCDGRPLTVSDGRSPYGQARSPDGWMPAATSPSDGRMPAATDLTDGQMPAAMESTDGGVPPDV
jgi:hypothetical protein